MSTGLEPVFRSLNRRCSPLERARRSFRANKLRALAYGTPHWGDASFVCPVDVSHLGSTGSMSGAGHNKKIRTTTRVILIFVWSVLDSNQVSLRFACSVRFVILVLLRCRLHYSFTHHASASLHLPQAALRLRAQSMFHISWTLVRGQGGPDIRKNHP